MKDYRVVVDEHVFDKYASPETLAKIVDYGSVGEMWQHTVKEYGESIAVVDKGNYTYNQVDLDASHIRATLKNAGINPGERVCIYYPNSYDFVKTLIGVLTYGCTAVLLPIQLDAMSIFGCTYKYNAKAIFCLEEHEEKTAMAVEKLHTAVITPNDVLEEEAPMNDVTPDSECVVIFTGGTTGKSKGALLSHRAVMRGVKNGCYGYPEVFGHRYFLVLPLTHVFGLIRNLLTAFYTNSSIFICRNNAAMFQDIAVYKPTLLVLVPALAEMALNLSKKFGRNMLGDSVKYIICGAAVVAPYLVEEYGKLGITLFPGYGLTESANLVSGNPESASKPSSVGIPYPGQEIRVVDGELWIKGVNMMDGYLNDENENAGAYEDGWFKTGDLVKFDEDGFMSITGRIKEIIVLSTGENVSPAEVEGVFNDLDVIQDSLVYASKNENGQEILAVQVVPRMVVLKQLGVENVASYINEKISEANKTLPAFERVSKVIIRDSDFERSPSMKILRDKNGTK